MDDHVFCFVGVSDKPSEDISLDKPIMLDGDSESKFPYRVSCNVRYSDGEVSYVDCVLPGDT